MGFIQSSATNSWGGNSRVGLLTGVELKRTSDYPTSVSKESGVCFVFQLTVKEFDDANISTRQMIKRGEWFFEVRLGWSVVTSILTTVHSGSSPQAYRLVDTGDDSLRKQ